MVPTHSLHCQILTHPWMFSTRKVASGRTFSSSMVTAKTVPRMPHMPTYTLGMSVLLTFSAHVDTSSVRYTLRMKRVVSMALLSLEWAQERMSEVQ